MPRGARAQLAPALSSVRALQGRFGRWSPTTAPAGARCVPRAPGTGPPSCALCNCSRSAARHPIRNQRHALVKGMGGGALPYPSAQVRAHDEPAHSVPLLADEGRTLRGSCTVQDVPRQDAGRQESG